MNFLISGIGRRNALIQMIREEAEQFNIQLIGADANEFAPARYEFNKFILLPQAHNDQYKNTYRDLLLNEEIRAMITLIDPEISQISRLSQELSLRSFHPDMDVVDLCEDKYQFAEEAARFGINVIKTQLSPFEDFPFIRKDRKGSGASGYKLINNPEDDSSDGRKVEFVYQPYCGAIHYCIDAYFSVYTAELIDLCVKQVLDKFRGESYC